VFETALVRRVSKKADFLRYAAYEMGLEQLRRKRVDRLSEAISYTNIGVDLWAGCCRVGAVAGVCV
jgi:hypothetical protein